MLKLRNPGWPTEGASGSPVSVFMPGHIAPEDEERAMEAEKDSRREERMREDRRKLKRPDL